MYVGSYAKVSSILALSTCIHFLLFHLYSILGFVSTFKKRSPRAGLLGQAVPKLVVPISPKSKSALAAIDSLMLSERVRNFSSLSLSSISASNRCTSFASSCTVSELLS